MSETFEYDVFLSYSSKDKETVHALAKRLKKDRLHVWLDAWAIKQGDDIYLAIERSTLLLLDLFKAGRCFILRPPHFGLLAGPFRQN